MNWIAALVVCLAASVVIGWVRGYTQLSAYLVFWAAVALAGVSGWRLSRLQRPRSPSDAWLRAAVAAFAVAIGVTLVTASIGRLSMTTVLSAEALLCAATLWPFAAPLDRVDSGGPRTWPPLAVAVAGAMVVLTVGFAAWYAPYTLYDSLSYHLFFAGRWVQDHALAIIPTPFSDEAQAYAPANGEVFFAWLMLPFHGDLVARAGQLPFALLGALALYAIARHLGQPSSQAIYPSLFFLLARPIAEQMAGADVDVICAACFLASGYLVLQAVDRDRPGDWAWFGVAAGLFLGSKYVALVYAPVLLVLACARGVRRRALWAIPGIAAFGLPWYLRNWMVAGSPIYPSSLSVAGITIARGAFTRAAMLDTVFHTNDLRLIPALAAHAFGPALFVVWVPCAVAGSVVMVRRSLWPHGALAALPWLMAPLYWFAFPVNVDTRFFMPAVGLAMLPFAFAFPRRRGANMAMHAVYALAAGWLLAGARASLPASLPWYMKDWLALDGLVRPPFLPAAAVLVGLIAVIWLSVRQFERVAMPALVAVIAGSSAVMAAGANQWCAPAACAYLTSTPTYVRTGYEDAWEWIDREIAHATIAYSGINLPYPLAGPALANRVVYVNTDGRLRWRFHDYDRAFRRGRLMPSSPALAVSSGELMATSARAGDGTDALRPRYERMRGDRDAWVAALESERVRYLFVAVLSAYEIDYLWHTDRGFPIEDAWAESDPVRFRLVYRNPEVRIYAFDARPEVRG